MTSPDMKERARRILVLYEAREAFWELRSM
jgi:hypothetical protein